MKSRLFNMSVLLILIYLLIGCTKESVEIDDPQEVEVPEVPNIGGQRYVSPAGSDMNPGTYEKPWATWQRALDMASPGDTVYFRGGIYYNLGTVWHNSGDRDQENGTENSPIHLFNYPNETPILDGIKKTKPSAGLIFLGAKYFHIKGLTVRNNLEIEDNYKFASNFTISRSSNIIVENCTSYNSGRRGFYVYRSDEVYLLNCDSYNNCDSLDTSYRGGGGDGFLVWDNGVSEDIGKKVVLRNCRAWNNSDDGYDIETEGLIVVEGCWALNNGYLDGDGMGFKFGLKDIQTEGVTKILTNCVSAFNTVNGFTTNDRNAVTNPMHVYNNVAYGNGRNGFLVFETSESDTRELQRIYRNNISYNNVYDIRALDAQYTHSHNTWDSDVTLNDGDFISLDSSGITGDRMPDGSIPYTPFLRLVGGGDLIDAGLDVGLEYSGRAPDLGAWEY
jgi:hypothetical protein